MHWGFEWASERANGQGWTTGAGSVQVHFIVINLRITCKMKLWISRNFITREKKIKWKIQSWRPTQRSALRWQLVASRYYFMLTSIYCALKYLLYISQYISNFWSAPFLLFRMTNSYYFAFFVPFRQVYVPTGFEKYSKKYKVREYTVQYSIWDTSGKFTSKMWKISEKPNKIETHSVGWIVACIHKTAQHFLNHFTVT